MANVSGHVPQDVITVILLRLPVKSLLRCKSVCKSWLSIISNLSFIKSHLHNATVVSKNIPKIANVVNPVQLLELQDLSLTCPVHIDFIVMPRFFVETLLNPIVVGCYNGIICLCDMYCRSVYLWNPSIRQCRKIPAPREYRCNVISINFGYDSINDDYKVLIMKSKENSDELALIQVYSSNANSWRDFRSPIVQNWMVGANARIAINGVLYIDYIEGIISFNLHTEVFGLVSFPSFIQRKYWSYAMNFEDCVAVVFQCVNDGLLYLCTLEDVSGQMTWINKNSVKGNLWLSFYLGMGLFLGVKPINSCDYNVLYDCEKKVTKLCEPLNLGIGIGIAHKYTESLVSLKGFQQVE